MSIEQSIPQIIARVTEPGSRTHLVATVSRPGIRSFFASIEYLWYPPNTVRANLFQLSVVSWEAIWWAVASFPTEKLGGAKQIASKLRLRIADGVPTIIGGTPKPGDRLFEGMAIRFFPGAQMADGKENKNLFSVESTKENPLHNRTSVVELNTELVKEREGVVIDTLSQGVYVKPLQIYNFIYGFDPHPSWRKDA